MLNLKLGLSAALLEINAWSGPLLFASSSDLVLLWYLGAHEHGAAKPDASIFLAACARLELPPGLVLHVGDHHEMDVAGACRAGLRSCWLNREGQAWASRELRPDLEFDTLAALADWLDATQSNRKEHAVA